MPKESLEKDIKEELEKGKEPQNNSSGADEKEMDEKGKETKKVIDLNELLDKDPKLQAQFDKKIEKATEKAVEKAVEEAKKQQEEAERLEKLSKEEKEAEERRLAKEELDKERKEISLEKQKIVGVKMLQDIKDFPYENASEAMDFLVSEEAGETKKNIETFHKMVKNAVDYMVDKKLAGTPPKQPSEEEVTRELNLAETMKEKYKK